MYILTLIISIGYQADAENSLQVSWRHRKLSNHDMLEDACRIQSDWGGFKEEIQALERHSTHARFRTTKQ